MDSLRAHFMAVDRVEKRLKRVTAALEAAGIPYAVIGGNAVAFWVAQADPSATRATKDVDLLVNEDDLGRITDALNGLGFERHDLRRLVLFVDPEEPSRRSGVHMVWAGMRVRPSYICPAPMLDEGIRSPDGYRVLSLAALVRMKLTSFLDIDRVHIADLLSVGLINDEARSTLPHPLLRRLEQVEATLEEE